MGGSCCIILRSCAHLHHHSSLSRHFALASDFHKFSVFLPLPPSPHDFPPLRTLTARIPASPLHPLPPTKSFPRSLGSLPFWSSMEPPTPAMQSSPAPKVAGPMINFCPSCGGPTEQRIPEGEEKPRATCTVCGGIHYQNPKMVVGCLVVHEDKVLLCKRSIEPSYGLWTLPAGYMELGESAVEGAVRETWEEATAEVEVQALFAHLDIPRIGQSYIIFRAKLKTPQFAPGHESLECALFKLDEIPFEQIAFSSIRVALNMYVEDFKAGTFRVHHGVIDKRPGASPSDPLGFSVRNHICS